MTEEEWKRELEKEGFTNIAVSSNGPGTEFPSHTHDKRTAHVILEGEMTLSEGERTEVRRQGERFEIPAGTTHSVKCGPEGCTFIVGFKEN